MRSEMPMANRPFPSKQNQGEVILLQARAMMAEARTKPPGPERDHAMKEGRQLQAMATAEAWASSSGLKAPD
jgi:hypothetical protein